MKIDMINLFVQFKSTEPMKMINHDTGIYEIITPTKIETKLIKRLISKTITKPQIPLMGSDSL